MIKTEEIPLKRVANLLKLLGDQTRLTLVGLLENNEYCVCELVEILQVSQPSISQHLRKLKDAGIVKERRQGKWVHYSLNIKHETYQLTRAILNLIPLQVGNLPQSEIKDLRKLCK